jgi:hypothetical protein
MRSSAASTFLDFGGGRGAWPQIEVEDAEAEYRVSAELVGLDEKEADGACGAIMRAALNETSQLRG